MPIRGPDPTPIDINEYVLCEEEPPFWSNERSNVSILLAAAARAGSYIALSEYPTNKSKKRKRVNGRCDLFICKKSKPWPHLQMEAKSRYIGQERQNDKLEKDLKFASRDAKALYKKKSGCQAGLLYEVMSVPENEIENFDIKKFKKKFSEADSDLCWFWYDSDLYKERENGKKIYKWGDHFHPGVAVFLRLVD
jgi:hypothetical protein